MLDTDDGETYIPINILVDKKDKYIAEPGDIHVEQTIRANWVDEC